MRIFLVLKYKLVKINNITCSSFEEKYIVKLKNDESIRNWIINHLDMSDIFSYVDFDITENIFF
jgi:hypothetical protein